MDQNECQAFKSVQPPTNVGYEESVLYLGLKHKTIF